MSSNKTIIAGTIDNTCRPTGRDASAALDGTPGTMDNALNSPAELKNPPAEFSLLPFWFWNDHLEEQEIVRQIEDFQNHGVLGFVLHPRLGLPREIGFLSDAMLDFMELAVREATRRNMKVILYDEGMYPSGSAAGQVVAANPEFHCRCLAEILCDTDATPTLPPNANLVAQFGRRWIIDRPVDAVIRGLHYLDSEETQEETPPAGDILNPQAVATFIHLVHDRMFERLGRWFGETILGVFTDEPDSLGRCREENVWPGTRDILPHVNRLLGEDFTPYLPALFDSAFPDADRHRQQYEWAIHRRMEETWYAPLYDWCQSHGVALIGHPAKSDEIGAQQFFHVPGQDLVWRQVLPDHPSSLEGSDSTQAKCSSSAMIHARHRRNSNEFCGAYGDKLTFDDMKWLANWCLVRGVNCLIPHAFYYSVRGPRRDERPPDVGPNSPWWDQFAPFAAHVRRLSWVNTDCTHHCRIAVLTNPEHCPWQSAKVLYQHQRDFNYLDTELLLQDATVDQDVQLGTMSYCAVIAEPSLIVSPALAVMREKLQAAGLWIEWTGDVERLLAELAQRTEPEILVDPPQPGLRVRRVQKQGLDYFLLFNERHCETEFRIVSPAGPFQIVDTYGKGEMSPLPSGPLSLTGHEMLLLARSS